ncbi:hypothetical protein QTP88_018437 [Uroleucon formosanum]
MNSNLYNIDHLLKLNNVKSTDVDSINNIILNKDLILPQINTRLKSIICGDININIMRNTNTSNEYLNIMARYGLLTCINNFTRIDINHLNLLIRTENWYTSLNHDNVDDMIEVFNSKIKELKNLKKCRNLRIGLLLVLNILNKLVRLSKQLYYQNRLQHAQSDTKLVWNIINEVTSKPNQIANSINKIRNKAGKNLDIENINTDNLLPQNNTDTNDSLFLKQINKDEIIKLIVTINCIIKFLLNLPMTTSTSSIYKEINVKHLKCIYKLSVLVDLYKHKNLITLLDNEHNTRYKQNINILLPNLHKVFGQHSVLYTGLKLCRSLSININEFKNVLLFKNYVLKIISTHAEKVDAALNESCRLITGCLKRTPLHKVFPITGIASPYIRRTINADLERTKLELTVDISFTAGYTQVKIKINKELHKMQKYINENPRASPN